MVKILDNDLTIETGRNLNITVYNHEGEIVNKLYNVTDRHINKKDLQIEPNIKYYLYCVCNNDNLVQILHYHYATN